MKLERVRNPLYKTLNSNQKVNYVLEQQAKD